MLGRCRLLLRRGGDGFFEKTRGEVESRAALRCYVVALGFASGSVDLQRAVVRCQRIVPRVDTFASLPIPRKLVFGCACALVAPLFFSSSREINRPAGVSLRGVLQAATGGSDLGDASTGDRGVRRQRRVAALRGRACVRVRGCRAISSTVLLPAAHAFVFCAPSPPSPLEIL